MAKEAIQGIALIYRTTCRNAFQRIAASKNTTRVHNSEDTLINNEILFVIRILAGIV